MAAKDADFPISQHSLVMESMVDCPLTRDLANGFQNIGQFVIDGFGIHGARLCNKKARTYKNN